MLLITHLKYSDFSAIGFFSREATMGISSHMAWSGFLKTEICQPESKKCFSKIRQPEYVKRTFLKIRQNKPPKTIVGIFPAGLSIGLTVAVSSLTGASVC